MEHVFLSAKGTDVRLAMAEANLRLDDFINSMEATKAFTINIENIQHTITPIYDMTGHERFDTTVAHGFTASLVVMFTRTYATRKAIVEKKE